MQETKKPQPIEELDDYDRESLKQLLEHHGWEVYKRIQTNFLLALREGTGILSLNDPLNNREDVINAWAYYGMAVRVVNSTRKGIEHEIAKLDKEKKQYTQAEEHRRRVAWSTSGMIGEMPEDFEPRQH